MGLITKVTRPLMFFHYLLVETNFFQGLRGVGIRLSEGAGTRLNGERQHRAGGTSSPLKPNLT